MKQHLKRFLCALGALVLGIACMAGKNSCAEETAPSPPAVPETTGSAARETAAAEGTECPADPLPRVINRWDDPDFRADFAPETGGDLLEIWLPQVHEMDATILRYQGETWMIDCGSARICRDHIVPVMKAAGIERIDRIFNTHPHHDHLEGFFDLAEAFPIGELLLCFPEDTNPITRQAAETCREKGIRLSTFADEEHFGLGDGSVELINWQKVPEPYHMNDRSAQFMISFGDCSMLIMADIEWKGMPVFFEAMDPARLKADILRYPHHGKDAMPGELYEAIAPELVIFTGQWVQPGATMASRFMRYRPEDRIYTSRGIVKLTCDGKHWICEKISEKDFLAEAVNAPETGGK